MKIERSEHNGVTVLIFEGRLDTTGVPTVDQAFAAATAEGATRFVWDFEKLHYISSAGLRSVLQALKHTNAKGGQLAIASPAPMVLEVFEISGFKSLLKIFPDRAAALATVGA